MSQLVRLEEKHTIQTSHCALGSRFLAIASVEKIVKQDSRVQSFDQPDNKKKINNRGQNTNPV